MSVQVYTWTISGADAASFKLSAPTCSNGLPLQQGAYLEQGTKCSASLSFKPRRPGQLIASLDIQDSTGVHSIPITGTAP